MVKKKDLRIQYRAFKMHQGDKYKSMDGRWEDLLLDMEDDDMMDPGISRDDSEIGLPKSALPRSRSVEILPTPSYGRGRHSKQDVQGYARS